MNKYDWIFVGVRLLGVWFLVGFAIGLPGIIGYGTTEPDFGRDVHEALAVAGTWLFRGFFGALLCFKTAALCALFEGPDRASAERNAGTESKADRYGPRR